MYTSIFIYKPIHFKQGFDIILKTINNIETAIHIIRKAVNNNNNVSMLGNEAKDFSS